MNIENHNAYAKLLSNGSPTVPFSFRTMKPQPLDEAYADQVREYSSLKYGKARAEVDQEIRARYLA